VWTLLREDVVDQIYDICPGLRQDSLPEALIEEDTIIDPHWGPLRSVSSAYAADEAVRIAAATGGVLTALARFPLPLLHDLVIFRPCVILRAMILASMS